MTAIGVSGPTSATVFEVTDLDVTTAPQIELKLRHLGSGDKITETGIAVAVPLSGRLEASIAAGAEMPSAQSGHVSFPDMVLATKWQLMSPGGLRPGLTMLPAITFPIGSKRLSIGEVALALPLVMGWRSRQWEARMLAGWTRGLRSGKNEFLLGLYNGAQLSNSIVVGAELLKQWSQDATRWRASLGSDFAIATSAELSFLISKDFGTTDPASSLVVLTKFTF